jgi:hypothetical protein
MAFIPIIDVIKLVPEYLLPNNQIAVNTLYVGGQQEVSLGLISSVIDVYAEWAAELALPLMSNQVALVRCTATDMTVENGQQVVEDFDPPVTGGQASPMQPAQVTFCTSFRTGYSGRNKRGRAYWIGLNEAQVTGSFVNSVNASAIRSAWAGFGLAMADNSTPHVVVSRTLLTMGGTATYNDVTSYVNVTERVATQRRRLPGAGS